MGALLYTSAPLGIHDGLRIGEVARAAGVNIQTLLYYERRRRPVASQPHHTCLIS
jgi:MerR HTH family regulatory protein